MPFDGVRLSDTAKVLVNYQKWLELNGEKSWHQGAWRRNHTEGETTFCFMAGLMEANGGYEDRRRDRLIRGDLAGACRTLMLCLPESQWVTHEEYAQLVAFNDSTVGKFERIKEVVDKAVEAEVRKCLVLNATVGS